MATFTISMSGSAVVNGSKSWTLTDADVQKLSDYLVATYTGTPQAAMASWAQIFVNNTISNVQSFGRAQSAVTPIVFT